MAATNTTEYIEAYKKFLSSSPTEQHCAEELIQRLLKAGFVDIQGKKNVSVGDRIFADVKGRTVLAAVVGAEPEKFRIIGSHTDAPKLDLKPVPFFEAGKLALMELHDYGWVKPYQWVNTPLALLGRVYTRDGECIRFSLGSGNDEPVFTIPDIPPHISGEQMKKPAEKAFSAEQLNAICGGISGSENDGTDGPRETVLAYLKEYYGVSEEDFTCADLSLIPACPVRDVGFAGTMLGGYGQDDRSSVFASLQALIEMEKPLETAVAFFVDKEEVASTGETSAQSNVLRNFTARLLSLLDGEKGKRHEAELVLEQAVAISADVTTGFNPNFAELYDQQNVAYLGGGVAVEKYGAAGTGKFKAHEARAEFMQHIRSLLNADNIPWQSGTLAKLGVGGGGTIAQFLSRYGMDCVDAGPPLLGMHSPFEVAAKDDLYAAYRLYRSFFDAPA